jgi:hypothetical protein
MSSAFISTKILNDAKKDEWFIQLCVPDATGLLGRRVVGGALGRGEDETLAQAMTDAGVTEIVERPQQTRQRLDPVALHERPAGVKGSLLQCGIAIEQLTETIRAWH